MLHRVKKKTLPALALVMAAFAGRLLVRIWFVH